MKIDKKFIEELTIYDTLELQMLKDRIDLELRKRAIKFRRGERK